MQSSSFFFGVIHGVVRRVGLDMQRRFGEVSNCVTGSFDSILIFFWFWGSRPLHLSHKQHPGRRRLVRDLPALNS